MNYEQIRTLLSSSAGASLKDFLHAKLDELKSIENIQEYSTTAAQALEIKAQKRAYNKLKSILEIIMDIEQDTKDRDPRDDFFVA